MFSSNKWWCSLKICQSTEDSKRAVDQSEREKGKVSEKERVTEDILKKMNERNLLDQIGRLGYTDLMKCQLEEFDEKDDFLPRGLFVLGVDTFKCTAKNSIISRILRKSAARLDLSMVNLSLSLLSGDVLQLFCSNTCCKPEFCCWCCKILTLRSQAGARLIRTPRKNMFVTMTAKIVESVIIIMLRQNSFWSWFG